MARKKKTETGGANPLDQIESYLVQNKGDHYNFEERKELHYFERQPFA